ncbi:MAG: TRASH domain-containing protein [Planctomycetaceae bacterium]|nr:TRASH domain-containing protein [Planctomycetaceae bacterium]
MKYRHFLQVIPFVVFGFLLRTPVTPAVSQDADRAAQKTPTDRMQDRAAIEALRAFHVLVGDWRGVGQPRRGSRSGAWIETTTGRWDFAGASPSILLTSPDGKQFRRISIQPTEDHKAKMVLETADQRSQVLLAQPPEGDQAENHVIVFLSQSAPDHRQLRCTVRIINDIRTTLLFEESSGSSQFRRLAEIGYTRAGERLAQSNSGDRECIVTGGLGTISVKHDGKIYYVCCQGCKQAFDADPAGTVADYRERLQEKSTE